MTLSGMIPAGHLLSKSPLGGKKINGEDVVDIVVSKNSNAKISHSIASETFVPNIFELEKNK